MIEINFLAVLAAAVAAMALGALWYSPLLFGKQWVRLMGWGEVVPPSAKKSAAKGYAIQLALSLVTAYVLAHFVFVWGAATASEGLALGFFVWLGFEVPVMMGAQLWEGKSWKLFAINASYQLVALLVAAVILTLWA